MHNTDDHTASAPQARLLVYTSWADDGDWRFLNILRSRGLQVDLFEPLLLRRRFVPAWVKRLSVRLSPFYQPLLTLLTRKGRYDAVLTLSTRIGTIHGMVARLFSGRGKPLHILRDFHLDFTRFADPVYQLRMQLVRLAVPGTDAFLTTSDEEVRLYSAIFGIDPARIRFFPDTPGGAYMSWNKALPEGDYIFAYGNSDRDFDTLLRAAPDIKAPVVILSQAFRPTAPLPPGARCITGRVPREELIELIARARVVVIPTKSYYVAAGQNAMLEVLALSRPLVVTENVTTVEHAVHERDALLYPARDSAALAREVNRLLNDPELAAALGQNGRLAALACPDRQADILLDMLGALLTMRRRTAEPEDETRG